MGFDKSKAMRSAEKFLSQGKIKAAIGEYKQVVDNDAKDFGTMNLLGDLYTKVSETSAALKCYETVAEHYSKQGYAQKAIAVYNKINRIQPNSVQVSEKLAELYRMKGSLTEAKSHYVLLAENYQAKGRIVEALAMWKQIALLDPANTEVYTTIADAYLKEGQTDEAVDSLADAGDRFVSRGMVAEGEAAFLRGLELMPVHPRCLSGLVNTQIGTGRAAEACEKLEAILAENKGNRDVLYILIDCYLEAGDTEKAERSVIKLVELEPANYTRFLDLARYFLVQSEIDAATRMLTMASEHMLAGGQADEFASVVDEILVARPGYLDAVRLQVRFCTWQRDDDALRNSLRLLAEVARENESVDDERFALSQLVMLVPQEAAYPTRLKEINELHGFADDAPVANNHFDERFLNRAAQPIEEDASIVSALIEGSNGEAHAAPQTSEVTAEEPAPNVEATPEVLEEETPEQRRKREADSIRFYAENGYTELAVKAIDEFCQEFGEVPEVEELRAYVTSVEGAGVVPVGHTADFVVEPVGVEVPAAIEHTHPGKMFDMGEFREELGIEDDKPDDDSDFETKYQTAIAYKEMGLMEQAIAEFQDAAGIVEPNDGSRRFFSCANLLGLCFMENGMPKLALKWYERALEVKNLNTEEKQALWYELGVVHQIEGDYAGAERYFEQVYAENVDFRDVRERLKNMAIAA